MTVSPLMIFTSDRLKGVGRFVCASALCLSFCVPASLIRASTLDPEARHKAKLIADDTAWVLPRSGYRAPHPLGVQTLSIESQESKRKQPFSVLKVYQYHYDLMQARVLSVDTDNARLLSSRIIHSVHLPLSAAEITYASRLIQSNRYVIGQLRKEQVKRGVSAFVLITELDVKASIYEPMNPEHACYRQRCALMSLFDETHTVFAAEPVVNLQTQQVNFLGNP
ncbi:MAG: hypothetical protein AB8B64_17870 [Granulosicoccus sp.]